MRQISIYASIELRNVITIQNKCANGRQFLLYEQHPYIQYLYKETEHYQNPVLRGKAALDGIQSH
ncbi:hypothetical protein VSU01S_22740 [Vibrio superstes NBRC 103154]|uniref:Uncharacterized protein n=1 Tax=Vibrio superstes NBRC 103154 TaxID=1219062 RepID=A0A511QRQ8_9VIBR|nr:hypothetical protein VSU01S_22740 [Vibrio superstes NBRC 103154]